MSSQVFGFECSIASQGVPTANQEHDVQFLPLFWRVIATHVDTFNRAGHRGRLYWVVLSQKQDFLVKTLAEHARGDVPRVTIRGPVHLSLSYNGTVPVWRLLTPLIDALVRAGVLVKTSQVVQVFCEHVLPVATGGMDALSVSLTEDPDSTSAAFALAEKRKERRGKT